VKLCFADEARLGQTTSLSPVLCRRGQRPVIAKQMGRAYVHVLAAVCPDDGSSWGMISDRLDTDVINGFLAQFSGKLKPDERALLVWDGAGVHISKKLVVPANVELVSLPPYSPELNPTENLWHWHRSHFWSNRTYVDRAALHIAAQLACDWATDHPDRIKTTCATPWMRGRN
jgi:hypothetical protein